MDREEQNGNTQDEMRRKEEKFRQMTESPVEPLLCRLAVPTILSMLVTALYNLIDTMYVGHLADPQSTAAVGVAFSMMSIIQAIGFFFGHGSGNAMSNALGRKDYKEASEYISVGFFSSLLGGTILGLLGILFLSTLSGFLGATPSVLPYCNRYLRWILIGSPFMTTALVVNNQLRLQGNAFLGMIGIMTGAVLNVILDPFFIFILDLKVEGAAIATIISQLVSFCILVYVSSTRGIPILLSNFKPRFEYYCKIFNRGFPSLCRQAIGSVAAIIFNRIAGGFGDEALAAFTMINRVTFLANAMLVGYGHGFQPICGFNYGAKKYDRVIQAFRFGVISSTLVMVFFGVIEFVFAKPIIGIFGRGEMELITIAVTALRFQCLTFPTLGVVTLTTMLLQNLGYTTSASVLSSGRQGLFLAPVIMLTSTLWGLLGIEIAQPIADIIAFAVAVPCAWKALQNMDVSNNR